MKLVQLAGNGLIRVEEINAIIPHHLRDNASEVHMRNGKFFVVPMTPDEIAEVLKKVLPE